MSDPTAPVDNVIYVDFDFARVSRMTTRAELVAYLSAKLASRGHPPELAEQFMRKLEQLTGGRW
jgi:hypothetical protein